MYKLSDFKQGQKAYVELTGNASRYLKPNSEEVIKECIVESVGKKYVIANGRKFEEHDASYSGLKEHTSYCVNFVLYPTKQDIIDKFEKENIIKEIRSTFTSFGYRKAENFSLEKLRKIKELLDN